LPVLVLVADADLLAPPSMMRARAAHLKNYEFATAPESGRREHAQQSSGGK
jgi:pimeloyl-ACP methyl ester carboxylesterase